MPDLLRGFIRGVSRLAPAWARREFRAEWEGELAAARTDAARSWPSRVRIAARLLGSIPDAWFLFRQQWSLEMLFQDLRHGLRLMRRRPGYTLIVLCTLAIGIGANTAVFSVIDGVLLRPLPFTDPSRLMMVWENDRLNRKPKYPVAPANFDDWRTHAAAFAQMAAFIEQGSTVSAGGDPFQAQMAVVTTNFFDTLGVRPAMGRGFTAAEATPPHHRVLVLSDAEWRAHFASDPSILDRPVQLGGATYRIVGVMPSGFAYPNREIAAWRPMAITPQLLQTRAQHFLSVIGRLAPSATLEQAHRSLEEVALTAQRAYPQTNDQRGTTLEPLREAIVGDVRKPMYLLGAAVALLLLMACANVANLMLVQATTRRRELAVRAALGADRFRIARQLLVEGLLLAVAGGAAGVALAAWGTRVLARVAVDYVPRIADVRVDPGVLAFAVAISLGSAILFAFAPAASAARTNVQADLREGARGTVGGRGRVRSALVVFQFGAAVVMVIGAALVLKSFWRVLAVQPGFATSHVLLAEAELPASRYGTGAAQVQFYTDLLARLTAVPGVRAAGAVNNIPLSGDAWTSWLTLEHRSAAQGEPPEVGYRMATPGYFAAMQIPIVEGRGITDADTAASQRVVVVNRALVDRFFPSGGAVGSRIRLGPGANTPWITIVGIAGNVHHAGPEVEPVPEAFEPLAQDVNGAMTLAIRAEGDPQAIVTALRAATRAVDPAVALWRVQWIESLLDDHLAPRRLSMILVEGFGAVALALALLGIYGVMSQAVNERVPEIGVRIALGADPAGILRMVIRDGLRLAVPGLLLGAVAAACVTRLARALLFEVSPTDAATFASVAAGALLVATAACYLPARRAARIDPLTAIRRE